MREFVRDDAAKRVWDRFRSDGRRWVRPWSLFALARWIDSAAREGTSDRTTDAEWREVPVR
jgi:hypothetical protein